MIEARLQKLGIELPLQSPPAANYAPFVRMGSLVFISGQITFWNGELKYVGKIGDDFTLEIGQKAARLCALNVLAQLKAACEDDLNRVKQCIRLGGFVNTTDDFKEHPKVINGASNLMIDVFEERGRHARTAIGVNSLPFGVAVEVEALFEVNAL
jgi:enamine deaminase RidA (YjgF/YER057c/UK114 family)